MKIQYILKRVIGGKSVYVIYSESKPINRGGYISMQFLDMVSSPDASKDRYHTMLTLKELTSLCSYEVYGLIQGNITINNMKKSFPEEFI